MRWLAIVASIFAFATAIGLVSSLASSSISFAPGGAVLAGVIGVSEVFVAFAPTRGRYRVTGIFGSLVFGGMSLALWGLAALVLLLMNDHPEPRNDGFWVAVVASTVAALLAFVMALRADQVRT